MKSFIVRLHRTDGQVVEWRNAKDEEEAISSVKTATLYAGETIEAFDKNGNLLDVRFADETSACGDMLCGTV